jgi:hypothetical protein
MCDQIHHHVIFVLQADLRLAGAPVVFKPRWKCPSHGRTYNLDPGTPPQNLKTAKQRLIDTGDDVAIVEASFPIRRLHLYLDFCLKSASLPLCR